MTRAALSVNMLVAFANLWIQGYAVGGESDPSQAVVISAYVKGTNRQLAKKEGKTNDEHWTGGLEQVITVEVENIECLFGQTILDVQNARNSLNMPQRALSADHKRIDLKDIVLYLRGRPILDAHPLTIFRPFKKDVNGQKVGKLDFLLRRTAASKDAWDAILAQPLAFTHRVSLTVGYKDNAPVETEVNDFELVVIPVDWVFWVSIVGFAFLVVFFWRIATNSNVVRDSRAAPPGQRQTYSLARSQMAFWFFLVLAAYLVVWMATRDRDVLPEGVLALMGIAATTAFGAVMVDANKRAAINAEVMSLGERKKVVAANLAFLRQRLEGAVGPDSCQEVARVDEVRREIVSKRAELDIIEARQSVLVTEGGARGSKGFWIDILSDDSGFALHRLQMVVWTIVLGIVFVSSVISRLAMPEFNPTLLTLMGVSGVTYVGFKWPESMTCTGVACEKGGSER